MLNTNKCSIQSIEVQFVKAAIIVISVHLKISTLFVVRHVLSAKMENGGQNKVSGPRKRVPFLRIEVPQQWR